MKFSFSWGRDCCTKDQTQDLTSKAFILQFYRTHSLKLIISLQKELMLLKLNLWVDWIHLVCIVNYTYQLPFTSRCTFLGGVGIPRPHLIGSELISVYVLRGHSLETQKTLWGARDQIMGFWEFYPDLTLTSQALYLITILSLQPPLFFWWWLCQAFNAGPSQARHTANVLLRSRML